MIDIINLKLNSGFFKTKNYLLLIEKNKLIMSSDEYGNIYILKDDINTINLIIKEFDLIDFEINTKDKTYTGRVNNNMNVEQVVRYFKNELGNKLKVELY